MQTLLSALLTICVIACSPSPSTSGYRADFIAHVKNNCSASEMDCGCILTTMHQRWPNQNDAYTAARKEREPRGETDVVNFIISSLKPVCAK